MHDRDRPRGSDADDILAQLELLLDPGEVVLWSGRPHYPYFRSEAWAAFVFGLIALGAASAGGLIFFFAVRDVVARGNFQTIPALPIPVLAACVFSGVAYGCLRTPWVCRRRLARAVYAVTNRRVIVRGAPGYDRSGMVPETSRELYVFTPEQARACEAKSRHGRRVDLVFTSERAPRTRIEIGILGAEDWEGAEKAIKAAFSG